MTRRLLLQLGWLFHREAEALLPDPYAYPRMPPGSPEAQAEAARLHACASAIFDRAEVMMGPDDPTGTDAAFEEAA